MTLRLPLHKLALASTLLAGAVLLGAGPAAAITVSLPGEFQTEVGCPGDWDPACPNTGLTYNAVTDRWVGTFAIPAGAYQFKVAIDGSWAENYGAGGVPGGNNIYLVLGGPQNVTFTYDHNTKIVTHDAAQTIVAPGSFQSEIGCPGDWDPACLFSHLTDLDGDGIHTYSTLALPPGSYESKIALGGGWDVNFGEGGVHNGPNLAWAVPPGGAVVTFYWNENSMVPWVTVDAPTPARAATWGGLRVLYR